MKQSIWWPVGISAFTLATLLAVLADIASPIRPALVFTFIFLCPGLAYVRLLGLGNRILEWTLSVAFSISVATLVSEAMLFAGLWSSPRILVIIVLITAIGVALQLWRLSQVTKQPVAGLPAENHV